MTVYSKKIYLECEEDIRDFALSDIKSKVDLSLSLTKQLKILHKLPLELELKINLELEKYGIPNVLYSQSYIRPKGNIQGIHIDGTAEGIIKSAINIPLKGSTNSKMIWYSGNYTTGVTETLALTYHYINWSSAPVEDSSIEIDSAHLLRVDRPHSAQASINEDRWIFTMRFKGNPDFEELVKNI